MSSGSSEHEVCYSGSSEHARGVPSVRRVPAIDESMWCAPAVPSMRGVPAVLSTRFVQRDGDTSTLMYRDVSCIGCIGCIAIHSSGDL
jgi:hypothetical protein